MRILVILSRFPYPLEKGDKLRAYNFIKYLSRKHSIFLFSLTDKVPESQHIEHLKKFCTEIVYFKKNLLEILYTLFKTIFKSNPFQVEYFYSYKAQSELDKFYNKIKPDAVFCQLIRVGEYVKNYKNLKILDYMDAFSKGIERRSKIVPFYLKPIFKSEYKRLVKYEHDIFEKFDEKLIISDIDRDYIPHSNKMDIKIIENGVDFDYFKPHSIQKKYEILFAGNMAYPPNVLAALYLIKEIFPEIKKSKPDIRLLIAGAHPTGEIKKHKSSSIEITGWVNDIRECYNISKILVAPLQIGTGMQNKILEAMSMNLPCITTTLVNAAIKAVPGREILIADSLDDFISSINILLNDDKLYKNISENAYNFVRNKYDWNNILKKLDGITSL
jgi:polysaccharide biosynthesis protein PslH